MSRRRLLLLGGGAFVVAVAPWWGGRRGRVVRRSVPVMGTIAELVCVHGDVRAAHAALDAAADELFFVDRTMSRFRAASDVGRLNRSGDEAVVVDPATAHVVRAALGWAHATDGAFDPCLGRVVELWDVGQRRTPPEAAAVRRLAGRRLYRSIDVDRWRGRPALRRHDPDAELDLGGIAKGHGVDRAVRALRERGVRHALVNVGGDLYALGRSGDGDLWRIGVRSPEDPSRCTTTVDLEDRAVATSGDYLQGFEHGGRRYHHLLDPATGEPCEAPRRSLTVAADTCEEADAAATAHFSGSSYLAGSVQVVAG